MLLELTLIENGLVTMQQVMEAVTRQQTGRPPLGRLAVEHGEMTMGQVFEVLKRQADTPKAFGQLALEMGFLREEAIGRLLWLQGKREQPIGEILVEIGCLSQEKLESERRQLAAKLRHRFETCDVGAAHVEAEAEIGVRGRKASSSRTCKTAHGPIAPMQI